MENVNGYEKLMRYNGLAGFAHLYLMRCDKELKSDDPIDIQIYTKLVELDSRLGLTASEQLRRCLEHTTRSDIIKVQIFCKFTFKNVSLAFEP